MKPYQTIGILVTAVNKSQTDVTTPWKGLKKDRILFKTALKRIGFCRKQSLGCVKKDGNP